MNASFTLKTILETQGTTVKLMSVISEKLILY